jgi:hypothetical protein
VLWWQFVGGAERVLSSAARARCRTHGTNRITFAVSGPACCCSAASSCQRIVMIVRSPAVRESHAETPASSQKVSDGPRVTMQRFQAFLAGATHSCLTDVAA